MLRALNWIPILNFGFGYLVQAQAGCIVLWNKSWLVASLELQIGNVIFLKYSHYNKHFVLLPRHYISYLHKYVLKKYLPA